jgi:hypothetical protein
MVQRNLGAPVCSGGLTHAVDAVGEGFQDGLVLVRLEPLDNHLRQTGRLGEAKSLLRLQHTATLTCLMNIAMSRAVDQFANMGSLLQPDSVLLSLRTNSAAGPALQARIQQPGHSVKYC